MEGKFPLAAGVVRRLRAQAERSKVQGERGPRRFSECGRMGP